MNFGADIQVCRYIKLTPSLIPVSANNNKQKLNTQMCFLYLEKRGASVLGWLHLFAIFSNLLLREQTNLVAGLYTESSP